MRVGDCVGNYRLVRLLAQGGMGAVYEARNEQLGRRVAVKIIHSAYAHDHENNLRFFNEARIVNLVNHPGLVTIHEYGTLSNGTAFIVMEYLEGQTLSQYLRGRGGGPLPICLTVRIARQVAAALSAAHDRGVVHRDLKPDNLMLIPDPEVPGGQRIKVLDFGIAKIQKALRSHAELTRVGIGMGTPGYVAPEQIYGASSVEGRADVYSLGVILYELLTGSRPFQGQSGEQEMHFHLTRVPPSLLEWAPTTPPALAGLVHAMLAKQPEQRPSMRETWEHLNATESSTFGGTVTGQSAPKNTSLRTVIGTASIAVSLVGVLILGPQSSPEISAQHPASTPSHRSKSIDAGVTRSLPSNAVQKTVPAKTLSTDQRTSRAPTRSTLPKGRPTKAKTSVKDPLDENTIFHLR